MLWLRWKVIRWMLGRVSGLFAERNELELTVKDGSMLKTSEYEESWRLTDYGGDGLSRLGNHYARLCYENSSSRQSKCRGNRSNFFSYQP